MQDEEIIDLYWKRNESAISETERKYGRYCHAIAWNILYSKEDSEEIVNDTWVQAWNVIPPGRPDPFRAFLGKITRNLSLNLYEKNNAGKRGGNQTEAALDELSEVVGHPSDAQENLDLSLLTDSINAFLNRQDAETRKIFVQRYWYMRPVKDIAHELHCSQSKVKMTLLRMREKLKEHLSKEGFAV